MYKVVMCDTLPPYHRHVIVIGCPSEESAISNMDYFYRLMENHERYYLVIEEMTQSEIRYYEKVKNGELEKSGNPQKGE